MKKSACLLFIILLSSSISGCTGEIDEATGEDEEGGAIIVMAKVMYSDARLDVSHGEENYEILIRLNHTAAPNHADNFRSHILQGNYDGVDFHRIIDDFVIQGGDFENRDGTGGFAANWYGWCNGVPIPIGECSEENYTVPDEVDNGLRHFSCTISMAHAGPNTGGSQFFLIPGDVSHLHWLDGVHTVFGDVVGGCDYVTTLSGTETNNDRPIVPVKISSAEVSEVYTEQVETRLEAFADLRGADLTGADLRQAGLQVAWLNGANLTGSNLNRAYLHGANLHDANLTGANMIYATLRYATLYGANLNNADLSAAILTYADLTYANLSDTYLSAADLSFADLENANLENAKMNGANLTGSNLNGAYLHGAFLHGTNLTGANMAYATLRYANPYGVTQYIADLSEANLTYADLTYANLSAADLSFADLSFADLSSADLENAKLNGADLTGAGLSGTNLNSVVWNNTICPDETNSDDNGNTCENNL